jgi:multiple sugar transport system substrate-binding protein
MGRWPTSNGSPTPDVQKKWWSMGGYSCHKAVLEDPNFVNTAALRG